MADARGAKVKLQPVRPPAESAGELREQRRRVGVGRRHESLRLEPRELQYPPAGIEAAPRLGGVQADELGRAVAVAGSERGGRERQRP